MKCRRPHSLSRTLAAPSRAPGFTLIEIIVVVGIILLLVGILLPALAAARRSARRTETLNQLQAISSSCEQYRVVFHDYPGPANDAQLAADRGFTGAQNVVLGLMGAMTMDDSYITPNGGVGARGNVNGYPIPLTTDTVPTVLLTPNIGQSVNDLGDRTGGGGVNTGVTWRTYAHFYNPRSGETLVPNGAVGAMALVQYPAFVDRYRNALPILYFRRVPNTRSPVVADSSNGAYLRLANGPLINASSLLASDGTICSQSASSFNSSASDPNGSLAAVLAEPSVASTARGGFALISAGEDRVYGQRIVNGTADTSDDVVVIGGQ